MKEAITEMDSNEQNDSKERTYSRLLELYYNSNITTQANMLKKCIPDLDCHYQNRFIRKNDKIWVEANLSKIVQKASDKIQKLLFSKNQQIKNTIDLYQSQFQTLSKGIISQIRLNQLRIKTRQSKDLTIIKNSNTLPCRNQSFSVQNVNSEPSCTQIHPRKTFSSKRVFRVRQYKTNFQEMINNTRYVEKLQKVKLESTFAEFFFQKELNPEQIKPIQNEKNYFDKIKVMTNIRWNFNSFQKSQSIAKTSIQRQSQNLNKHLGFQLRKQSYYKPKSKCQSRNNKTFLNL